MGINPARNYEVAYTPRTVVNVTYYPLGMHIQVRTAEKHENFFQPSDCCVLFRNQITSDSCLKIEARGKGKNQADLPNRTSQRRSYVNQTANPRQQQPLFHWDSEQLLYPRCCEHGLRNLPTSSKTSECSLFASRSKEQRVSQFHFLTLHLFACSSYEIQSPREVSSAGPEKEPRWRLVRAYPVLEMFHEGMPEVTLPNLPCGLGCWGTLKQGVGQSHQESIRKSQLKAARQKSRCSRLLLQSRKRPKKLNFSVFKSLHTLLKV